MVNWIVLSLGWKVASIVSTLGGLQASQYTRDATTYIRKSIPYLVKDVPHSGCLVVDWWLNFFSSKFRAPFAETRTTIRMSAEAEGKKKYATILPAASPIESGGAGSQSRTTGLPPRRQRRAGIGRFACDVCRSRKSAVRILYFLSCSVGQGALVP